MTSIITDLEKITLTVAEFNGAGTQVSFGGVPVWTSSNEAVATVLTAADGVSTVASSVAIGSTIITVAVDGLSAVWDVTVMQSPGVQLVITAGTPEPK